MGRNFIVPIIFVILISIFGAAFIGLLGFLVPLMMGAIIIVAINFLTGDPLKLGVDREQEKSEKGLNKTLQT